MLRLNPDDGQGLRLELVSWLLCEGRDSEAGEILSRYRDEPMAYWLYSQALLIFWREGPSNRANRALEAAMKANRFAPLYLLERKKLPAWPPDEYVIGEESEAAVYASLALEAWRATSWAREWLATSFFWFRP